MSEKQRFDAMMVEEYTDREGNGRSKWTKIGAAFTNKDGSIGIQLIAFPMNGKVILQIPLSKEEREAKFGAKSGGSRPAPRGRSEPQRGGFGNYGKKPAQPAQYPEPPQGRFEDDEE